MRNASDESCRENPNTHFVFGNFIFLKIVAFMGYCGEIIYSGAGHR
jgi:hypothetical protein